MGLIGTGQDFFDPFAVIDTLSEHSVGSMPINAGNWNNIAWPSANKAIFVPFRVSRAFNVTTLFSISGGTISGNIDGGIYTLDGTRIVSKGSTAQGNTSNIQKLTVTTTTIEPGVYYLAYALSNATGQIQAQTYTNVGCLQVLGLGEMAAAFPLPATATIVAATSNYLPLIGCTGRSIL